MPRLLLIVGTSGYAKEIGQIARRIDPDCRTWPKISYVAEKPADKGRTLLFGQVDYTDDEVVATGLTADVVFGVGDTEPRRRLAVRYQQLPTLAFPNFVDPSVSVDTRLVTLGKGNVFEQGVVVTCDVAIGDFNLFNKGCIVSHDVRIGSFNNVYPAGRLLSRTRLGNYCSIGCGAIVVPKVSIADNTILGAGAVLLKDVSEPGHTLFGVPARIIR